MSIVYCEHCDKHIDTDYDVDHFDDKSTCRYKPKPLAQFTFEELLDRLDTLTREIDRLDTISREVDGLLDEGPDFVKAK